jgi:LytS/YehU family sensor histidine kinase
VLDSLLVLVANLSSECTYSKMRIGGELGLFLGGITNIPCGLATILAGLAVGAVYSLNKGRPVKIRQGLMVPIGTNCHKTVF